MSVTPVPVGQAYIQAALGGDGRIYVLGLERPGGKTNGVESLDVRTQTWRAEPPIPHSYDGFAAVAGSDGRIYVVGGGAGKESIVMRPTLQIFDPRTQRWSLGPPMPTARWLLAAASGPNSTIYALGGDNDASPDALPTVEAYNIRTGVWSERAPMPRGRMQFAAVLGPDRRIYCVGRAVAGGHRYANEVDVYDPRENTWSRAASVPVATLSPGAVTGPDGKIYIIGGYFHGRTLDDVQVYDPKTGRWSTGPPLRVPRSQLAAVVGPDSRIYAIGGMEPGTEQVASVEALAVGSVPPAPSMALMRAAVVDRQGHVRTTARSGDRLSLAVTLRVDNAAAPLPVSARYRVRLWGPGVQRWITAPATVSGHFVVPSGIHRLELPLQIPGGIDEFTKLRVRLAVTFVGVRHSGTVLLDLLGSHPRRWRILGPAPHQPTFYAPSGVAVDSQGHTWVLDAGNRRVVMLSPDGRVLHTFAGPGARGFGILPAEGLAADRHGRIYLTDTSNNAVEVFSAEGKRLATWENNAGSIEGPFSALTAVAVGADGRSIIVAGGGLERISPTGHVLATWGVSEGNISNVAVAPGGDIYVVASRKVGGCANGTCWDGFETDLVHLSQNGKELGHGQLTDCGVAIFGCPLLVTRSGQILMELGTTIHHVSAQGQDLGEWLPPGAGPGNIGDVGGMTQDARGNFVVTDAGLGLVQKLSSHRKPLAVWGTAGSAPGRMMWPSAIVAHEHALYVADTGNSRIQVLSLAGRPRKTYRFAMGQSPHLLTFNHAGDLIVSRSQGRIAMYSRTGKVKKSWRVYGGPPDPYGGLHAPAEITGLAVTPTGTILVAPTGDQANLNSALIDRYSQRGELVGTWHVCPRRGDGCTITGLAVGRHGAVYLAERFSDTKFAIEKLGPDGRSEEIWKNPEISGPGGLAVDRAGRVYVADAGLDRVLQFASDGKELGSWGASGWKAGHLHGPESVAVDGTGNVYVLDSGNNRVQVLRR